MITSKFIAKHLAEAKTEVFSRLNVAAMSALADLQEATLDRVRSEFAANVGLQQTPKAPERKYRLKDIKTGSTRGIFASKKDADDAHSAHPEKKKLMVEEIDEATGPAKSLIPAYKRKASGAGLLKLKDLEDEKNASPTTDQGLKDLKKKTGIA